jgi:ferredoxin-NADP reductase
MQELTISSCEPVATGVVAFELKDSRGRALPPWSPGAHVDVHIDDTTVRQYSLCGDPEESEVWRIAVLRQDLGREGSKLMHESAAVGKRIRVSNPRNNFPLAVFGHFLTSSFIRKKKRTADYHSHQ